MITWGVSALSHDAAISVLDNDTVVFAAHAERYSRLKGDPYLNSEIVKSALRYGDPDVIAWYEKPLKKRLRQLLCGQSRDALRVDNWPRRYIRAVVGPHVRRDPDVIYVTHHDAHAAAASLTSGEERTAVIVADAIGEFDTMTIGRFSLPKGYEVLHRVVYPHSLGLLYSAVTRRCGFKPNEHEYIVMGLAGFGQPRYLAEFRQEFVDSEAELFGLRRNVHRGIGRWRPEASPADLAATVQLLTEEVMLRAAVLAREVSDADTLVLGGGLALNCVANACIARVGSFDRNWIFPNPGDGGASLGAAAMAVGRMVRWPGPYLGTVIDGSLDLEKAVKCLAVDGVVGVARGRAEFGPRALGNRSILADPRSAEMKQRMNTIKGREDFRPFAPVVQEEHAAEYFDLPMGSSPYMQFAVRCLREEEVPAVVHVDGTSRVQTVNRQQHPEIWDLLENWYQRTGCRVLLNTSLNVKGEPLADSAEDARITAGRCGITLV